MPITDDVFNIELAQQMFGIEFSSDGNFKARKFTNPKGWQYWNIGNIDDELICTLYLQDLCVEIAQTYFTKKSLKMGLDEFTELHEFVNELKNK